MCFLRRPLNLRKSPFYFWWRTGFSDMDAGMWLVSVFFKIEYWNFQDKLLLWFREASQNLSLFTQLFFYGFQWGTKGKMLKNCQSCTLFFSVFFLWSPIGNHEKKSCLNKLKFWEASRNHKRSLSREFQYSILKNAEMSHIPASISENPVPLCVCRFWVIVAYRLVTESLMKIW